MNQQGLPKVTVQDGHLMLGEKPLYMCTVHRGCGKLPFYEPDDKCSWGDQAEWISHWKPVIGDLVFDDENVQRDPDFKTVKRTISEENQATFCGYQLYTFEPDEDITRGEVRGFWELASLETSTAGEDIEDCEGGPVVLPVSARGP